MDAAGRAAAGAVMLALLVPALLLGSVAADDHFSRGMALAREGNWEEARQAFESGWNAAPGDKRYPVELAGLAFRQKQFEIAKKYLRAALRLDPEDEYANEFLGTLFMLDGNQEAALKYWNRAGGPRVEEIRMEVEPEVDPLLVDRAFAFSPAGVVELDQYRLTQARLAMLGVFQRRRLDLLPREDEDSFDAVFRSTGRGPWWLRLARGLAFQTVHPEFYNLQGSALNFTSMIRWDAQKRRAFAALSGPVARDPGKRFRLFLDGRNENWHVSGLGGFNLRKIEGGAGLDAIASSRWEWGAGFGATARQYRNISLAGGTSIWSEARVSYQAVAAPEKRFTLISASSWRMGRTFEESLGLFAQGQGTLEARWFPQSRGEDFATVARFRAGTTFGRVPFDNLYVLGLERDNDLWLRAHIGTEHGQKGSAPMGRGYLLTNWELDKIVSQAGIATLSLGPFVDVGRIYGDSRPEAGKWLWDVGAQLKVRVAGGFTAAFSYGKDLRTGRGAFYVRVSP